LHVDCERGWTPRGPLSTTSLLVLFHRRSAAVSGRKSTERVHERELFAHWRIGAFERVLRIA